MCGGVGGGRVRKRRKTIVRELRADELLTFKVTDTTLIGPERHFDHFETDIVLGSKAVNESVLYGFMRLLL